MTAKKVATKKAAPRKRAAKKAVSVPLPVQPKSQYFDQHYTQDSEGFYVSNDVAPAAPKPTWWQRIMAKIDAMLDGEVRGTTDPP